MRTRVATAVGVMLIVSSVTLATASTPDASTVTVPGVGQAAVTATWTGSSPAEVEANGCDEGLGLPNPTSDGHAITVTVPAGLYASATSTTKVDVTNTSGTFLDLLLTDASGATVASAFGTSADATLETTDIPAGSYTLDVCTDTPGVAASTPYKAALTISSGPRLSTVAFDPTRQPLTFQPATVVDPTLFGGEPGLHFDPTTDGSRSYVDWPVSSRTNIGLLYRSEDGGLSYTKRYADPSDTTTAGAGCVGRQVPICLAGGGGDTNSLPAADGRLVYTSQVALANEAVGVSTDHGDTFPAASTDTAVGQTVTGVDRQWPGVFNGTHTVFTGFHVPLVGYYLERNDHDGAVGSWYNAKSGTPADVPNIVGVAQSGSMVIDNTTGIHGTGAEPAKTRAIYVGYLSEGGTVPGACSSGGGFAVGTSLDGGKTFTCTNIPGAEMARSFTVLALDRVGNLYAAWADSTTNKSYLAVAKADFGGNLTNPGSVWSKPVQISDSTQNVTIFPNVVAGDPGRVAIGYYGTAAKAATPDAVPKGAGGWSPFVATSTDALCQQSATPCAAPTFASSLIASKPNQDDNICTSGTTCIATMGNRNLLDYFDINLDHQGHLGFVWADANNTTLLPYVKVTRQASGPSLYAGQPDASLTIRQNGAPDAAGDAIYPFYGATARTSPNHPDLDLLGTTVGLADGHKLQVRMRLADTSALGTLPTQMTDGTTLLQQARYVTRFDTVEPNGHGHAYYVEVTVPRGSSTLTAGAGETSLAEGVTYPGSPNTTFGNDYRPLLPATATVQGGELVADVDAASLGNLAVGSKLISVGSYATLGATDAPATGLPDENLLTLPITVDSTPTFDTVLGAMATTVSGVPPVTTPRPTSAAPTPAKASTKPKPTSKPTAKPAAKPASKPTSPTADRGVAIGAAPVTLLPALPKRTLAFTGLSSGVGLTGLALVVGAGLVSRRRRAARSGAHSA